MKFVGTSARALASTVTRLNEKTSRLALVARVALSVLLLAFSAKFACASDSPQVSDSTDPGIIDYWLNVSKRAREDQPHWITPLVTVTPRLEQEYRYDQLWQTKPSHESVYNYDNGKGLEFIPTYNSEVIIGVPAYVEEDRPHKRAATGWEDEKFLYKYRLLTANEENGNYILTAFVGLTVPTGDPNFTNHYTVWTPTIAAGKGWGTRESGFDIQSTLSGDFPDAGEKTVGVPLTWNTTFQLHVFKYLWPEIETQYIQWFNGEHDGKNELIMTYGTIVGRMPLSPNYELILGVAYQASEGSTYRNFNYGWIGTARVTIY